MRFAHKLLVYTICTVGFFPLVSSGDGFVKFSTFEGESQDAQHLKWSNIEAYQFAASAPAPIDGGRLGTPELGDIVIVKLFDKASVGILDTFLNQKVIPRVDIEFTKHMIKGQEPYVAIQLGNARVSSVSQSLQVGADNRGMEEIALSFDEMTITYTEFGPDGVKKGDKTVTWRKPK